MRQFFCIVLLLSSVFAFAQVKDSLKYREDQFYIDFNLALQLNDVNGFQQRGFSRSLHTGVVRDFPMNQEGDKAIALGLGYGFVRLVNNINVEKTLQGYTYSIPASQRALRNVFSYHQLQLPVELRWRTSSSLDYAFWRVYLGYRLGYQFGAQFNPFFGRKIPLHQQLSPWQHSLGISIGYNTWNLRFDYTLTPLFKEEIQSDTGGSLKVLPIQMGLIFYIL